MTWFADMSPCTCFPGHSGEGLLAVGWLEAGHEFPVGLSPREVYFRLQELLYDP
jgi:hypothetical protein